MERRRRFKKHDPPLDPPQLFDFPHYAVVGYEDRKFDFFDVWEKLEKRSLRPIAAGPEQSEWNFEEIFSGKWFKGKIIKATSKLKKFFLKKN